MDADSFLFKHFTLSFRPAKVLRKKLLEYPRHLVKMLYKTAHKWDCHSQALHSHPFQISHYI